MKLVKGVVVSETAQRQNQIREQHQIREIENSLKYLRKSELVMHLAKFLYNSNQVREDMRTL